VSSSISEEKYRSGGDRDERNCPCANREPPPNIINIGLAFSLSQSDIITIGLALSLSQSD
jgi:hypothetical protein